MKKAKSKAKPQATKKIDLTIFGRASLVVFSGILTLAMMMGLTAYAVANDMTPGVTLAQPVDGAVVDRGEAIAISASVSDEVKAIGVGSLSVSVDGDEVCSGGGSESISCEWKAPNRPDAHTITAVATDIEGKVYSDAATITVACTLHTVNEAAKGKAAKTVTVCKPILPNAAS